MFRKRLQFETLEDRRVCALVIGPDVGYLERGALHPYVGWLETTNSDGSSQFGGSAVLIASNWVLLSAHEMFVVNNDLTSFYESYRVGFGSNFLTNRGENLLATEVFVHPTYRDVGRGFDLALLYFETPFTTVEPVHRYLGEITVGLDSDIVGFGRLQVVADPTKTQTFTGDRRAGNNVISNVPASLTRLQYVRTRIEDPILLNFRPLGMGGRPGDSGGGIFINGELAGITAIAAGDGFGALTDYSRLDNAWIDATIASKAKKWQNQASPLDVNADGSVTAFDALLVINFLNTQPGNPPEFQQPYLDVNGDDAITAIDALFVINALNVQSASEGEANDEFFEALGDSSFDWEFTDSLKRLRVSQLPR